MPIAFTLPDRLLGYAITEAGPGEKVAIAGSELIPPTNGQHLTSQLENLQRVLFRLIPGLPPPSLIDHLLVVIRPDLSATAYVNELAFMAQLQVNKDVEKGDPVLVDDIKDIAAVDPGVRIPEDCAVVFVRSFGWKRSLYFDFCPLDRPPRPRTVDITQVLARQMMLLLGIPGTGAEAIEEPGKTRLDHMAKGYQQLRGLLESACPTESEYQELLAAHPWMLGGQYDAVVRHANLDDKSIPDFTAQRSWDNCQEIVELKQPFLRCFRADGEFSAEFNTAWNQAERYLAFTLRQRDYLREEKGLRFENPRCLLIVGYKLSNDQVRRLRDKETLVSGIVVLTYDHLLKMAAHVLYLMRLSGVAAASPPTSEPATHL